MSHHTELVQQELEGLEQASTCTEQDRRLSLQECCLVVHKEVTVLIPGLLCHLTGRCVHVWLEATLLLAILYSLHKQPPPELKLH